MDTLLSMKCSSKWQGMIQTADLPSKYSLMDYRLSFAKTYCNLIDLTISRNGRRQPWSDKPTGFISNTAMSKNEGSSCLTPLRPPTNPLTETPT